MSRTTGRVIRRDTSTATSSASTLPARPRRSPHALVRRAGCLPSRPGLPVYRASKVPIRWPPSTSGHRMVPRCGCHDRQRGGDDAAAGVQDYCLGASRLATGHAPRLPQTAPDEQARIARKPTGGHRACVRHARPATRLSGDSVAALPHAQTAGAAAASPRRHHRGASRSASPAGQLSLRAVVPSGLPPRARLPGGSDDQHRGHWRQQPATGMEHRQPDPDPERPRRTAAGRPERTISAATSARQRAAAR
jgi:hypothetical protein